MKSLRPLLNSNVGLTLALLLSAAYFPVSAQAQNDFRFLANGATPEQLAQVQPTEDRTAEAERLFQQGEQQFKTSQFQPALQSWQQALSLYQEAGERPGEAATLDNLGEAYIHLSQYPQALEVLQQALALRRELRDRQGEGETLNNIGEVYSELSQYDRALETFEEALVIAREVGDRTGEGEVVNNIGRTYIDLSQHNRAVETLQQALAIRQETGDRFREGETLVTLAWAYYNLGDISRSLELLEQALLQNREVGNRFGESFTLLVTGVVDSNRGDSFESLKLYQQALQMFQDIGYRQGEAITLNTLGLVYGNLGQYPKAIEYHQQALVIQREVGDREFQGYTLRWIGHIFEQQNQPQLAILFYKQSVNITETIRQDLRQLPVELQRSYIATVADTYRHLADLLLQQNRILEAQRVLDLLKVQELQDYLQDVRGNPNTTQGIPNTPPEGQIWTSYQDLTDRAIPLGQELTQLRQLDSRTPEQDRRIAQLVAAQQELARNFNAFIESPEVLALVEQLSPATRKPDLADDLEDLFSLQDNLRRINQNAVLFYPLILKDRLELILVTPDSPPIRRTVEVTRAELNTAILEFRRRLQNPTRDATKVAQQLYNWLVKPLENDLTAAEAETLIYAPDGQLRYIPLAALHDGQGWLVERFRINNITAASLTDLNSQPQGQLEILAGAFANVSYPVTVGEEEFLFRALPYAGKEVEALVAALPNTTSLIDAAFSRDATIPQMDNYTVVHFATHGAFVVGSPQDSFIIFGDGKIATLAEIKNWSLRNVDLVVLSACQTGLGGELGNGDEILGLGYQFQRAGARAAIASLWAVDDGGTQVLMNGFYEALQQPGMTKAEALRQAQLDLIGSGVESGGEERGLVAVRSREDLEPEIADRLSHPYYWAPFILIGNGL